MASGKEVHLRIEHQVFIGLPVGDLVGIHIETTTFKVLPGNGGFLEIVGEKAETIPRDIS